MSEPRLLSVRGEAVVEVDPEIARIGVTVAAMDSDRAKAMRLLNDRAASIDNIVDAFREAIETTGTTAVRVSPQFKSHKPNERISGYVAVVHHTITVAEFSRLGELIAQLADQSLTEVGGPWWALRPDSPVHRSARIQATHDAVRRARDYAQALGSDLTDLVELAGTGLFSDARGATDLAPMAAAAGLMRSRQAAPEEFTFDIAPAKQTVRASVEARFTINEPDLAGIDARGQEGR
ncbi:MAG: SIMPL domain-containing protein [Acidimicrobiales bacterium]